MHLSLGEELITLRQAAGILPRRRRGRKPHISCLYRWTTTGCRGVVLESVQVGGTRCTSVEALHRFFEKLGNAAKPLVPALPCTRQQVIEKAEAEFEAKEQ